VSTYWASLRAALDAQSAPQPWTVDSAAVRRLWIFSAALALASAALTLAGGYHAGFAAINPLGAALPSTLLQTLTYLGDSLCVLAGLLLFGAHRREVLWTGALASLIATLASRIPKALFNAARPPAVLDAAQIHLSGPAFTSHGFPSGHTVSIFVAMGVVVYFARSRALRAGALTLAALVGASRVLCGVHWPVDVLAGGAIGLASAALAAPLAVATQRHVDARVQLALALLLAGCAVALFVHRPDYPLALFSGWLLGALALAAFGWRFVLAPRRAPVP
jgi:membrane-associated phospholipid phosphatase